MFDTDFEVDTAKVRQAARSIRAVAQQVQSLAKSNVAAMRSTVESELQGSTADALQEMLQELGNDVSKIAAALNTIQGVLTDYAERVEAEDARMAQQISG